MGIASLKPFLLKSEPSQSKAGIAAIDIVWDHHFYVYICNPEWSR